jgi:putative colanic acid biosynthesis glycosyltransferase
MKILQINSVCGYGSTGRNAAELAQTLIEEGHTCYIAYGQGTTSYENSFKVGTRFENHLHNAYSRLFGKQGYYTIKGTTRLIQYIQHIDPDIIHLQNLHGHYLNLKILFQYLAEARKPVVWTLHDCWAFTGKCVHYTDIGCYKWQTQCNHCPQIKKYPPSLYMDRTEQMFGDKKKWFTSVKSMTIAPVSRWLAGEVEQSFLSSYPIVPIYNWIDQKVFKPSDQNVRERYGIARDTFIILGVSAGWSKLRDFVKISRMLQNNKQIVLVGGKTKPDEISDKVIHIPYVDDTSELAQIYSMADVYVHLSSEETFGKVIAEALACGTPAIVYDSTACPEIVGSGCGFVVEKRNIDQILKAIGKVEVIGKKAFTSKCTAFVSEHFNYQKNVHEYINLYSKVSNT